MAEGYHAQRLATRDGLLAIGKGVLAFVLGLGERTL